MANHSYAFKVKHGLDREYKYFSTQAKAIEYIRSKGEKISQVTASKCANLNVACCKGRVRLIKLDYVEGINEYIEHLKEARNYLSVCMDVGGKQALKEVDRKIKQQEKLLEIKMQDFKNLYEVYI